MNLPYNFIGYREENIDEKHHAFPVRDLRHMFRGSCAKCLYVCLLFYDYSLHEDQKWFNCKTFFTGSYQKVNFILNEIIAMEKDLYNNAYT